MVIGKPVNKYAKKNNLKEKPNPSSICSTKYSSYIKNAHGIKLPINIDNMYFLIKFIKT